MAVPCIMTVFVGLGLGPRKKSFSYVGDIHIRMQIQEFFEYCVIELLALADVFVLRVLFV